VNLRDLLNIDMTTLLRLATQAVTWWLDELRELLPEGLRKPFAPQPAMIAQVVDGGGFQLWRPGDRNPRPARSLTTRTKALVLLPPQAVLEREVVLPAVSEKDRRRMLSLEIDRLTPFDESEVFFDVSKPADRDAQPGSLAVLRRSDARVVLENAEAMKLDVTAVSVGDYPSDVPPRFDFLPAIRRGGTGAATGGIFWWAIVAALVLLNLMLLVWRDEAATADLEAGVAGHRGQARLALRVHERVAAEAADRRKQLARRMGGLPLPILDALTKALPPPAWVQHVEWDGQTLRASGFKDPKQDLLAAMQASPAFADPKVEAPPPAPNATRQRFELTAEVRGTVAK
jgi:general secretion pathway protein L